MSWRTRPAASVSSPFLSDSDSKARRMGTRSVTNPPSAGAAELPADFAADARHLADDHQLGRFVRLAGTVDDDAVFGGQHRAAAAEVPRRRSARAQDRAHSVGGRSD